MKLTEEQVKMVEECHNLIYAYIHKRGLRVEDWYDILAIELCKTVMHYNSDRGAISTYFYIRCDSKVKNLYRKSTTKKRTHNGIVNLEEHEYNQSGSANYMVEDMREEKLLKELLEENPQDKEMLLLMYQGYTQQEVGEIIGLSQAQISRRLKKIKRGFLDYDE